MSQSEMVAVSLPLSVSASRWNSRFKSSSVVEADDAASSSSSPLEVDDEVDDVEAMEALRCVLFSSCYMSALAEPTDTSKK
jgi:hypothetical protein